MKKLLKDKKIIIYQRIYNTDPYGYGKNVYKPIHPAKLWAYVRQLSAKEFYESMTTNYQEERLFVINWRGDVKPDMMILYKAEWFKIVRVDPYEDYKSEIKLSVKEVLSGTPKPEDILPYE